MLEPPLRCLDCNEKAVCLDKEKNMAYYICGKSPDKHCVYKWDCCNDIKVCPLGKPNLVLVK